MVVMFNIHAQGSKQAIPSSSRRIKNKAAMRHLLLYDMSCKRKRSKYKEGRLREQCDNEDERGVGESICIL